MTWTFTHATSFAGRTSASAGSGQENLRLLPSDITRSRIKIAHQIRRRSSNSVHVVYSEKQEITASATRQTCLHRVQTNINKHTLLPMALKHCPEGESRMISAYREQAPTVIHAAG